LIICKCKYNEIILKRLPQENWAEYFDRPSGGYVLAIFFIAIVGSHSSELEKLRGQDHMYVTDGSYAQGILEAIAHYQWL
jgi:hypothetical protein